jgi:hypothetical protein
VRLRAFAGSDLPGVRGSAIEASRIARNGRDWQTLIEFCGSVGTGIVDQDGIRTELG